MSTPEEIREEAEAPENTAIRERARQRLSEMVPGVEALCPICGVSEWFLGEVVNLPIGRGHPSRKVYVAVPLICHNCGFMQLFHAGYLGALLDEPKSEGEGVEAQ